MREALEDILQTIPSIRSLLDNRQGGEVGRSGSGDTGNGGTSTTANQGDNNSSGSRVQTEAQAPAAQGYHEQEQCQYGWRLQ